jgi:hypothetical protein
MELDLAQIAAHVLAADGVQHTDDRPLEQRVDALGCIDVCA